MKNIANLLVAIMLLLNMNFLYAEVDEHINYSYYDVDRSSVNPQKLNERLNETSPIRVNEKIQHSFTRWKVAWKIKTKLLPNTSCKVTSVAVSLNAMILLPELKGEENKPLQKEFNRYAEKLQVHEVSHYILFAIQAANGIDIHLLNMAPQKNCQLLEQIANKQARAILSEYRIKEKEFDSSTNFGRQ